MLYISWQKFNATRNWKPVDSFTAMSETSDYCTKHNIILHLRFRIHFITVFTAPTKDSAFLKMPLVHE